MDRYLKSGNDAFISADMHELVNNVHPMKSTSAMIGAIHFSELASEIEMMARKQIQTNSYNIQEISKKYELLSSEYSEIRQILEKELE
jgi:hypothetical protein